jgi:hypothetical protein
MCALSMQGIFGNTENTERMKRNQRRSKESWVDLSMAALEFGRGRSLT